MNGSWGSSAILIYTFLVHFAIGRAKIHKIEKKQLFPEKRIAYIDDYFAFSAAATAKRSQRSFSGCPACPFSQTKVI